MESSKYRIASFTDLRVWQEARKIRRRIFNLVKQLPSFEIYQLASQMRRAALSVTSNLAEGCGRGSRAERIRFSRISRGSAFEVRDQLTAALDEGYLAPTEFNDLDSRVLQVIKMINAYITAVKSERPRAG